MLLTTPDIQTLKIVLLIVIPIVVLSALAMLIGKGLCCLVPSETKLRGLVDHYGYRPEGPALEYFSVHASRDREHAEQARALIERLLSAARDRSRAAEGVVLGACAALKGNWLLLDGVERASAC